MNEAVVASFSSKEKFLEGLREVRKLTSDFQAFSPIEIEELDELGPQRPLRRLLRKAGVNVIGIAGLAGGLAGVLTGFIMQWYSAVDDQPLNVGGRPLNSWPAFVPVTYILMILFAALSIYVAFFCRLRLPWPHHPVFGANSFDLSKNRFYILVDVSQKTAVSALKSRADQTENVPC